jgi:hypothetical protein
MLFRVVMALALAAGCKAKDKTVEAAADVKEKTVEAATDVKEKTVETAGDVADKAGESKSRLGGLKDRALDLAGDARDKVGAAKDRVVDTATGAFALAMKAKSELDKVYRSTHAWDLDVEDASAEATREHEQQLDKLPSVTVSGVRVGYEEDAKLSLRGTAYAKHFRASWKRGDKIVRVSFYTKEELDLVAFAELLEKLVPAVEAVL